MHTQKQATKQTNASVLLNAHQCLLQVWGVGLTLSLGSGVWGRSGPGRSAWVTGAGQAWGVVDATAVEVAWLVADAMIMSGIVAVRLVADTIIISAAVAAWLVAEAIISLLRGSCFCGCCR